LPAVAQRWYDAASHSESRALISLDHVSKSYDSGRNVAVRDVSLDIVRGAFVSIVGDSGSGKTTVLKTINRLVDPDAGTVRVAGTDVRNVAPSYEEKHFDAASKRGKLRLIASRDGREGSVRINQDANIYATLVDAREVVEFEPAPGRRVFVHVVRGAANVNGQALAAGDAMKLWGGDNKVRIADARDSELLIFDLP